MKQVLRDRNGNAYTFERCSIGRDLPSGPAVYLLWHPGPEFSEAAATIYGGEKPRDSLPEPTVLAIETTKDINARFGSTGGYNATAMIYAQGVPFFELYVLPGASLAELDAIALSLRGANTPLFTDIDIQL